MSRLSTDEYKKPPITFTESLDKEEIKNLLEEYEQVEDIVQIKRGTHLRYFSKDKDGSFKFRMGGILTVNNNIPKYIILSNGSKSWSVQIKDTIFFSKKSFKKIKEEFQDEIFYKDEKKKHLINYQKDKDQECNILKEKYDILKKEYKKNKK